MTKHKRNVAPPIRSKRRIQELADSITDARDMLSIQVSKEVELQAKLGNLQTAITETKSELAGLYREMDKQTK
jgi:hypothetical protein